jgi:tetratricopeptide (TPR) repeat protein
MDGGVLADGDDATTHATCFISYSHDSEQHRQAVVDFAQALRQHGIDVTIDRFAEAAPPANWPNWMARQIQESDFVVVVVTETYARRYTMSEEPGVGRGVTWEGAVINSHVYSNFASSTKFIPVTFKASDRQHIPFPLSETSNFIIPSFEADHLKDLLSILNNDPLVAPAPLGPSTASASSTTTFNDSTVAASQTATPVADVITELSRLSDSADLRTASDAAFQLGEVLFGDQQYSRAISAYRLAIELGPQNPVYSQAKDALRVAVEFMQSLYGEGSARAAIRNWVSLAQTDKMREAWKLTDRDVRLGLAQDWIMANANHPGLRGHDRDELANALSALEPDHPLAEPFLDGKLRTFKDAYGNIDLDDWGAAERQRRYRIEFELVILSPTKGESVVWDMDSPVYAVPFVLRRRLHTWQVAGFGNEIAVPGWPPTFEVFPVDEGISFNNPSPPAGKRRLFH